MNAIKTLFIAWQDRESRKWYPIGRLTKEGELYTFVYIQGVHAAQAEAGFQPLESFPDFNDSYLSDELFPLFSIRVPRKSRPDYKDYLEWLDVPEHEDEPMALLMRSGGRRNTDTFEVFPMPVRNQHGEYEIHFFPHGLRHMPQSAQERVKTLKPGDPLFMVHDDRNPVDPDAMALKTKDEHKIGYCPRYLLKEAWGMSFGCGADTTRVEVEGVNLNDTPLQYRLLCKLTSCWPEDFKPFSSEAFQPIPQKVASP